jgi:polysaccharide export outer membrane protein
MLQNILMQIIMKKIRFFKYLIVFFISGCSLSPGMHMDSNVSWLDDREYLTLKYKGNPHRIEIESINDHMLTNAELKNNPYKIGIGDKLSITVWGLPDAFPMVNITPEQNLRAVNTDGSIFFPYAGTIEAVGKTQVDLREDLTMRLSKFFKDPQLDVSISRFNSQKVFILGEVLRPQQMSITETPLSLADALGAVNGLNNNTSSGGEIFIIRQASSSITKKPRIFRADLESPAGFIMAGNFYLKSHDIVYVNANGTTRWNRVISQFFPFSSFLNSIDNLQNN